MLTAGENKNSPSPTRKRKSWSDARSDVEEDVRHVRNDVTNGNPADVANDDNHDDHTSDLENGSVRASAKKSLVIKRHSSNTTYLKVLGTSCQGHQSP